MYVRSVAMTAGSKFTHVSRNTVGKVLNLKLKKKKILSCKYQTAFSTRNNKLKPNRIMAAGSGELILEMGFARLAVL